MRSAEERGRPWAYAMGDGIGGADIGGAFLSSNMQTPTERMLNLCRQDLDLKLKFNVSPTPGGGASLGLSGSSW